MRGGERLTDECSQMNGIRSGLHHSTGIFRYPGVRTIHQGIPKDKAVLCPLGCLPCHNHGAASCGVFPSLGKPDWGKFFVVCLLGGSFTGGCGELHGNAQSINFGLKIVAKVLRIFAFIPNVNQNIGTC